MRNNPDPITNLGLRQARDKIKSISELASLTDQARADGKTVALAHGVFDLIHMGHVRHLEAARKQGDILIVTLTADQFVNKGPDRPIFSELLRAEMIAALEYVDWVGINLNPSAEPVIDAIKPNAYVKGSDYQNPSDDITGKIDSERDIVERHGGTIIFTDDITFSSSSLINSYLSAYSPELRAHLGKLKADGGFALLSDALNSIKNLKVLLIGDTIIDEYQYVVPQGKSPKENMISARFEDKEMFAGGVIAAANHVASFCDKVDVITSLGADDTHEKFVRDHLKDNVNMDVVIRPDGPTTRKCRFVESAYMRKLFEIYHMNDSSLPADTEAEFNAMIRERAADYDVVIVTDFGHGLISTNSVNTIAEQSRFLAVNTQTNSANIGYNLITKYPRADYICIDAPEARLSVRDKFRDLESIACDSLPSQMECNRIVLTNGKHGCLAYSEEEGAINIPAFTDKVIDTVGAGDAFFAVTAPLAATGVDMRLIGFIGNAVGAIKVGIVGHQKSVEKVPLMKFLETMMK